MRHQQSSSNNHSIVCGCKLHITFDLHLIYVCRQPMRSMQPTTDPSCTVLDNSTAIPRNTYQSWWLRLLHGVTCVAIERGNCMNMMTLNKHVPAGIHSTLQQSLLQLSSVQQGNSNSEWAAARNWRCSRRRLHACLCLQHIPCTSTCRSLHFGAIQQLRWYCCSRCSQHQR